MTLAALATGLAWLGVAITAGLALLCLRNPVEGLKHISHHPDQLPEVMEGRYLAFFGFSLFATLYGDFTVIAVWALALSFMAFADTFIYVRAGKSIWRHALAGIAGLGVAAVAFAAANGAN